VEEEYLWMGYWLNPKFHGSSFLVAFL